MGRGKVVEHLGGGRYNITVDYNNKRVDDEIKELKRLKAESEKELGIQNTKRNDLKNKFNDKETEQTLAILDYQSSHSQADYQAIVTITQALVEIAGELQKIEFEIARLKALILSADKKREFREGLRPDDTAIVPAWCVDLSDGVNGGPEFDPGSAVGLIEIADTRRTHEVLIKAGYLDGISGGQAPIAADGIILHSISATAWQSFYNRAVQPASQRWLPRYRVGTLTAINAGLGTVELDDVAPIDQNIIVNVKETLQNVPFAYMQCDALAFVVNDRVVVEFTGRQLDSPVIIGFESHPAACSLNSLVAQPNPLGSLPSGKTNWRIDWQPNLTDYDFSAEFLLNRYGTSYWSNRRDLMGWSGLTGRYFGKFVTGGSNSIYYNDKRTQSGPPFFDPIFSGKGVAIASGAAIRYVANVRYFVVILTSELNYHFVFQRLLDDALSNWEYLGEFYAGNLIGSTPTAPNGSIYGQYNLDGIVDTSAKAMWCFSHDGNEAVWTCHRLSGSGVVDAKITMSLATGTADWIIEDGFGAEKINTQNINVNFDYGDDEIWPLVEYAHAATLSHDTHFPQFDQQISDAGDYFDPGAPYILGSGSYPQLVTAENVFVTYQRVVYLVPGTLVDVESHWDGLFAQLKTLIESEYPKVIYIPDGVEGNPNYHYQISHSLAYVRMDVFTGDDGGSPPRMRWRYLEHVWTFLQEVNDSGTPFDPAALYIKYKLLRYAWVYREFDFLKRSYDATATDTSTGGINANYCIARDYNMQGVLEELKLTGNGNLSFSGRTITSGEMYENLDLDLYPSGEDGGFPTQYRIIGSKFLTGAFGTYPNVTVTAPYILMSAIDLLTIANNPPAPGDPMTNVFQPFYGLPTVASFVDAKSESTTLNYTLSENGAPVETFQAYERLITFTTQFAITETLNRLIYTDIRNRVFLYLQTRLSDPNGDAGFARIMIRDRQGESELWRYDFPDNTLDSADPVPNECAPIITWVGAPSGVSAKTYQHIGYRTPASGNAASDNYGSLLLSLRMAIDDVYANGATPGHDVANDVIHTYLTQKDILTLIGLGGDPNATLHPVGNT